MKLLIIILIIVVVLVGGYFLFKGEPASAPNGDQVPLETSMPVPGEEGKAPEQIVEKSTAEISFTDTGYIPASVKIKQGGMVTFKNESAKNMWPASAMHPTHAAYPTTGGCLGSTFDACRGVPAGESWSFEFDIKGEWKFHDHLSPKLFGSITVE